MKRRQLPYLLVALLFLLGCEPESPPGSDADEAHMPAEVHPIVDASKQQLFGASRDGKWMTADQAAGFISPGQPYRLYRMTDTLGIGRAAGLESPGETCQNHRVRISNISGNGTDVMAVAARWNALPRAPAVIDTTQRYYEEAVAKFLRSRGIEEPTVHLNQLLRVDLEGDGVDEVLIGASRLRGSATMARSGDYAVVLLRKIVAGEVKQIPLEANLYPEECIAECAPASYRIAAVLDVNGDGIMEVITVFEYFEGRGKRIHAVAGDTTDAVLSWRCGA